MTCTTASDLSLFEILEQRFHAGISVSLLAELERELLRLRSELAVPEWETFCSEFPKRSVFGILRLGNLTLRRLSGSGFSVPADMLDTILSDSTPAHRSVNQSPAHLISAWEHSLPVSRSIGARKVYFHREIAEVIRTAVKPRILVMGAGHMREAGDILASIHTQHVEFVALEPDQAVRESLRRLYPRQAMELRDCGWDSPENCNFDSGSFDLIYSPAWLDAMDDLQAVSWLSAGMEMLRPGGRILAANFAPGSRDAGWMEACWNWHPFYRSEEHLAQLVVDLKHPELRGHAVFRDESGASAFLEIYSL